MNEVPTDVPRRRYELIVAFILIIICIIAAVDIAMPYIFPEQQNNETGFTQKYTNVTAQEAYDLINNTVNLTIIDCRGLEGCSQCQFNKGHLPGAEQNQNSLTLYNWTNDILVYSKDGTIGAQFCQELINHVYCKIYNLIGGYTSWENAGYPKS